MLFRSVHLRMTVEGGLPTGFAWSMDGRKWTPVELDMADGAKRSLVRWDRVARPGLYHEGATDAPAVFEYAILNYPGK